jgi:two-component system chemotaxis response regulator CheY
MPRKASKLLIIDDDPVIAAIYRKKFLDSGFDVEIAEDASRGAAAICASTPDIVLLDLNLGARSGLELLRGLRAVPKFKDLPIVVITAEPDDSPMLAAANASAVTGVLRKEEWSVEAVLTAVDWALNKPARVSRASAETESAFERHGSHFALKRRFQ